MSLDITLYTEATPDELKDFIYRSLKSSKFSAYSDWYSIYPPGRFNSELLRDKGLDVDVTSTAGFRVRKESRVEEMLFLKSLLADISKSHKAAMLLNGEPIQ